MSDGMAGSPQRLDEARSRLARAVGRLEHSAEAADAGAADRQHLAAARAELAERRETQAALAHRLDAAIDRLRAVLGK